MKTWMTILRKLPDVYFYFLFKYTILIGDIVEVNKSLSDDKRF